MGRNEGGVTQKWVSLCCEKEWQIVTYIHTWLEDPLWDHGSVFNRTIKAKEELWSSAVFVLTVNSEFFHH